MSQLVRRLLKRVKTEERADVLFRAIEHGQALVVQELVLRELDSPMTSGATISMGGSDLERLRNLWCGRVQALSAQRALLMRPRLLETLAIWREWGDPAAPRSWCEGVAATGNDLVKLLNQLLQPKVEFDGNGSARLRLDLDSLEPYLDTRLCFERLLQLRDRSAIPSEFQAAANQFIREYELLAQGIDPDDPHEVF